MSLIYIVLGAMWVCGFFYFSNDFSTKWQHLTAKQYTAKVVQVGLIIRIIWVTFSYFFYKAETGIPFEFSPGDSIGYHEMGEWLYRLPFAQIALILFESGEVGLSDSGYPLYLTLLYKVIGPNIYITRIIKCFISVATCILLYNLGKRTFGESVGRVVGIFAMLMPNLIIYCGLHLKETEMIFLIVLFLERSDYLIRSKEYHAWTIAIPILLILVMFSFRTVLGAVAALSLVTAIVFTTDKVVGKGKRAMLIGWSVAAFLVLAGGTVQTEVESVWQDRGDNVTLKRTQQTMRGNKWARYATGSVMAPMCLFLPYPTMVDVDGQYNQQIMHGGNYVRNFLGVFVLIAIVYAGFVKKNWRNLTLVGSFTIGYLLVISMTGYSNSERFLLPGLPGLLFMAAYGVSLLDAKNIHYVRYWYVVVVLMSAGWAFFKLGSRGLF